MSTPTPTAADELIDTGEAMEITGLSRGQVTYYARTGRLTARRVGAGRGMLLYRRGDVEALRDQLAAR